MHYGTFELQRRIDQPYDSVRRSLEHPAILNAGLTFGFGADGLLVMQAPFRAASFPYENALHAPAVLTSGRGRQIAVVRFEISGWSDDASTLSLLPLSSRPDRWNSRRVQQYFTLAHLAADTVARLVDEEVAARYVSDGSFASSPSGTNRRPDPGSVTK